MLLSEKFGAARIPQMRDHMKKFAASFGIADMNFRDRSPNTRRALAIAELARDESKLDVFRDLAMDAHWRRDLNLEDDADLCTISAEAGLDPDQAIAASTDPRFLARIDARREEANAVGVTGIPTFVVGNQGLVGCQPWEVMEKFAEACGAKRR